MSEITKLKALMVTMEDSMSAGLRNMSEAAGAMASINAKIEEIEAAGPTAEIKEAREALDRMNAVLSQIEAGFSSEGQGSSDAENTAGD